MQKRVKPEQSDLVELLKDAPPEERLEGLRIVYGPQNKRALAVVVSAVGGACASGLWAGYYLLKALP